MTKLIDPSTPYGVRVLNRLDGERIAWLTTISKTAQPHPRPVWFLWDGESFLIYSRPATHKLDHIQLHPNVALNLDGDGMGGDIVVFSGRAEIEAHAPPTNLVPDYVSKYATGMERIGMTADQFTETYSVAIRVYPQHLRGH